VTRARLLRAISLASGKLPPPTAEELARYWEHCTNVLALQAIEVQAAWLEVLAELEARRVLVTGDVPPDSVCRMDAAVRALSKGPVGR